MTQGPTGSSRRPTLSGVTIARRAVDLGYPLEASIRSYLLICDEVVVGYDPASGDGTADLVADLARREARVVPIAGVWDADRRTGGTEIARQSQLAVDAANGDWVLYVQADEAIHEGDHAAILGALTAPEVCAAVFDRRVFVESLDREIPQYRRCDLLRLFRAGSARVAGDAITCELVPGEGGAVLDRGWRMFDYGRVGAAADVLRRKHALQELYHEDGYEISRRLRGEYWKPVRRFDPGAHPAPIRTSALAHRAPGEVTLAVLLGPGEHEHLEAFGRQFDLWPGDIVVIDDSAGDGGADLLTASLLRALSGEPERLIVRPRPPGSTPAAARNLAHDLARTDWLLHADVDERWDPVVLGRMRGLVHELHAAGATVCGLPRANYVDAVLVNDLPKGEWTEHGLRWAASEPQPWRPRHRDVQYRLVARSERWTGDIHERPAAVEDAPHRVIGLDHTWIVHDKTLERQRRQHRHYRELGQETGLVPLAEPAGVADTSRLRAPSPARRVRRLPDLVGFSPAAEPLAVPDGRAFRFLFVGGSGPADGGDLALICFNAAFRADHDVCLVVYDIAPDRVAPAQTLSARVRLMRDDPHAAAIVELQPEDPPARPPGLYTACDCLLAPFRSGDHGIIAEAMTCGLPVIAPDRDGWLDHCNAATAFLASAPGTIDTGALIGLMHHVVAQPAAARAVGERAAAALQRVGSIGAAPFPPGLTACIDACTDRGAGTTIDRCLDSLAGLAAQVVVVTLPGDQAGAVARARGADVHEVDASADGATAWNAALHHASHRWVITLAADEHLSDDSRDEVRRLVAGDRLAGYVLSIGPDDADLRLFPNREDLRYIASEPRARLVPRDPGIGFVVERCAAVIRRRSR